MVESLKAPYLLLAGPGLADPNFAKTVVLMGHHTKDGRLGGEGARPRALRRRLGNDGSR